MTGDTSMPRNPSALSPQDTSVLGKEVAISKIEAELKRLWEQDNASTKASLVNFAIYSEQPDSLSSNTALISEITRSHACRAILVAATLDVPEHGARAWITAHCNLLHGRKSVCSEQIAFELVGRATGRIRNIVFAHLVSDLPVVLWWQGRFSRIFEPHFYHLIDRLVVDSLDWGDDAAGQLDKLLEAIKSAPTSMAVHDLNWTRTYQMRFAFAMLFDHSHARAHLDRATHLVIAHRNDCRTTALLLAAWLSHLLQWRYVDDKDNPVLLAGDRRINLRLEASGDSDNAVSLLKMDCGEATFSVGIQEGESYYHARSQMPGESKEHLVPHDKSSPAELVSSQMARGGNNHLLKEILPLYRKMMGINPPS